MLRQLISVILVAGIISVLNTATPKGAQACSPIGSRDRSEPASLEETVERASYVFEGEVVSLNRHSTGGRLSFGGSLLTVAVSRYFKGDGPTEVNIRGFNSSSCSDMLAVGTRAIFFANDGQDGVLRAVYDGVFGSVRPVNEETIDQLEEIAESQIKN